MTVGEVLRELNFRSAEVLRLQKNGLSEYWFLKPHDGDRIYAVKVLRMESFSVKDDDDVTEIPLDTWLDFYKSGRIKAEHINAVIWEFVKKGKVKIISPDRNDLGRSYRIEQAGSFLLLYPLGGFDELRYVARIKEG